LATKQLVDYKLERRKDKRKRI